MRHIFLKELSSFFSSLIGYLVIGVFLLITSLFLWVFPETSYLEYPFADMQTFFSLTPFIFLFLIPAVCMRSFAEERKAGTLELLLTRPISDWELILGKFFATWIIVLLAILPTSIYYFSLSSLSMPAGNIDTAAVLGSYVGLWCIGGVFCALGILASSITENQIVAFILAVFVAYVLYSGLGSIAKINLWSAEAYWLEALSLEQQYKSMSKGLIDSRNVVYLASVASIALLGTRLVLRSRKWE